MGWNALSGHLHDRVWVWAGGLLSSTIATQTISSDLSHHCGATTTRFRNAEGAGSRDLECERDLVSDFSRGYTFQPGLLLTVSPFYHFNLATSTVILPPIPSAQLDIAPRNMRVPKSPSTR